MHSLVLCSNAQPLNALLPQLALMQPFISKSIEGINSCQVPIYYAWVKRDNCGQNALSTISTYRIVDHDRNKSIFTLLVGTTYPYCRSLSEV